MTDSEPRPGLEEPSDAREDAEGSSGTREAAQAETPPTGDGAAEPAGITDDADHGPGEEGCVADWCADEDFCELTCAAAVVGKKWHPVIVHRLLKHGPMGFNRLQERVDGISSTVLSDSLDDLQDHDVVHREVISDQPFRVEYSLTARGADLEPVVDALQAWGERHLSPASC